MKKHQIALLSGLVGAMCGSAANATALTENPDVTVTLAGSTAAAKALDNGIRSLCDTTTVELYLDKSSSGGNNKTYFCKSKSVTGLTDGTKLMIRVAGASKVIGSNTYAAALGGSVLGVGPVVYSEKLNFLAVSPQVAPSCTGDALASAGAICDDTAPGLLAPYVPMMGISDMHPAAFTVQNAPAAVGAIGSDALAKLTISPATIQIFNTPMTKSLRDAIQSVQFKAGKLDPACKDLSNPELGACTPSLTGQQIADIFGGKVGQWNEIDPAYPAKPIKVIRREIGSGTQAVLNLVGMSAQYAKPENAYPCVAGAQPVMLNTAQTTVVATGGAMVTALNNAETAGDMAIGLLDTTKNGGGLNAAPSASFRYVLLDGVAPTLANVAAGKYKMIAQATVNRLAAFAGTAQELSLVKGLTAALNDPAIVAKGNTATTLVQNFGNGGYLTVGAKSCTTDTDCVSNPVTAFRFAQNVADAPANFCSAPKAVW